MLIRDDATPIALKGRLSPVFDMVWLLSRTTSAAVSVGQSGISTVGGCPAVAHA
jgi:hypothetical protein